MLRFYPSLQAARGSPSRLAQALLRRKWSQIIGATIHAAMRRHHHAQPLLQAAQESPTLAHLGQLMQESTQRLRALDRLIPPNLRAAIQAGPIEDASWCLLVRSNAAAAKLRQMLPALVAHLQSQGYAVQSIRLKVLSR